MCLSYKALEIKGTFIGLVILLISSASAETDSIHHEPVKIKAEMDYYQSPEEVLDGLNGISAALAKSNTRGRQAASAAADLNAALARLLVITKANHTFTQARSMNGAKFGKQFLDAAKALSSASEDIFSATDLIPEELEAPMLPIGLSAVSFRAGPSRDDMINDGVEASNKLIWNPCIFSTSNSYASRSLENSIGTSIGRRPEELNIITINAYEGNEFSNSTPQKTTPYVWSIDEDGEEITEQEDIDLFIPDGEADSLENGEDAYMIGLIFERFSLPGEKDLSKVDPKDIYALKSAGTVLKNARANKQQAASKEAERVVYFKKLLFDQKKHYETLKIIAHFNKKYKEFSRKAIIALAEKVPFLNPKTLAKSYEEFTIKKDFHGLGYHAKQPNSPWADVTSGLSQQEAAGNTPAIPPLPKHNIQVWAPASTVSDFRESFDNSWSLISDIIIASNSLTLAQKESEWHLTQNLFRMEDQMQLKLSEWLAAKTETIIRNEVAGKKSNGGQ